MHHYLTPSKQSSPSQQPHSLRHNNTQPRDGDWVCLNCHNLNFSFRKKCNRCKVQTKLHNQQVTQYYQQLVNQHYYANDKQNFPTIDNHTDMHDQPSIDDVSSMEGNMNQKTVQAISAHTRFEHSTPQKSVRRGQLPSVSPLVKRYQLREFQSTQSSKQRGLCEQECVWAGITVDYQSSGQCEQIQVEWERGSQQQLQKLVQQIIL